MAYDIIKGLEAANEKEILELLHSAVKGREKAKGQVHKVFEESFDAKECYSEEFLFQKLQYIHHNLEKGKWSLAKDFTTYEHSSASAYESAEKNGPVWYC